MHLTDEQKKATQARDAGRYEAEMDQQARSRCSARWSTRSTRSIGTDDGRPDDPPEGRRTATSPRSSSSRSRPSTLKWIKGSKDGASEQAEQVSRPVLAAHRGDREREGAQARPHEARRRAALRRAGDGQGLRRHQAAALASATRWPAATATRASSPASCPKRTCRSSRTARRSTSCSTRWACRAV